MALVGTFGFNFQVVLPLLARFSFDGGATTYAALVSAMAVGSIVGALVNGAHGRTGPRLIAGGALAFGVLALLAAAMPSLALEIPVLALLGAAAVTFAATINSTLQLAVAPEMRGRVMALYSVVFLGSTPIGGPLAGWLAQAYDPRVALLLAGIAGLAAPGQRHMGRSRICARNTRPTARELAARGSSRARGRGIPDTPRLCPGRDSSPAPARSDAEPPRPLGGAGDDLRQLHLAAAHQHPAGDDGGVDDRAAGGVDEVGGEVAEAQLGRRRRAAAGSRRGRRPRAHRLPPSSGRAQRRWRPPRPRRRRARSGRRRRGAGPGRRP